VQHTEEERGEGGGLEKRIHGEVGRDPTPESCIRLAPEESAIGGSGLWSAGLCTALDRFDRALALAGSDRTHRQSIQCGDGQNRRTPNSPQRSNEPPAVRRRDAFPCQLQRQVVRIGRIPGTRGDPMR
jgi:hypothetical protein